MLPTNADEVRKRWAAGFDHDLVGALEAGADSVASSFAATASRAAKGRALPLPPLPRRLLCLVHPSTPQQPCLAPQAAARRRPMDESSAAYTTCRRAPQRRSAREPQLHARSRHTPQKMLPVTKSNATLLLNAWFAFSAL
eukprot:2857545-Pleurochrysis_carterae.AAC.1